MRLIRSAYIRARRPDQAPIEALRQATRQLAGVPASRPVTRADEFDNEIERRIARAWTAYGAEIEAVRRWAAVRNEPTLFPGNGMYDWIEGQILYLLIRLEKPEVVVEISPAYGYTTGFILLAMNTNRTGVLLSFDLDERFHRQARSTFVSAGIDHGRRRSFVGDVRGLTPHIPRDVDLLFMDSDHSASFASWYLTELAPRVPAGGLLHVHDVLRYGVPPHQGDQGEGEVLDAYLRERGIPEQRYLYVSEFVRTQPLRPEPLRSLERYPFGPKSPTGTNNVEQNASFWMLVG